MRPRGGSGAAAPRMRPRCGSSASSTGVGCRPSAWASCSRSWTAWRRPVLSPDELLGQRAAIERACCAASLAGFVRRAWPVLEPGQPLRWGRALDAICRPLEAVADGRIPRLLVNCPPGMMKSLLTGVFFPAWLWGPKGRPHARFIGSSYSDAYAARDARRMRDLVLSPWYRGLWGDTVRLTRVAETSFANAATGSREGVPFSRLTAGRADVLILDDPHSVAESESAAERERTVRLFRESVTTRLNDPERTAIVVIMQRLHERDISGVILAEGLGYEHLMLPMEFEPERRCRTSIGFVAWGGPGARRRPRLRLRRRPRRRGRAAVPRALPGRGGGPGQGGDGQPRGRQPVP